MRCFMFCGPNKLFTVALLMLFGVCAAPAPAEAQVKKKSVATFDLSDEGPSSFVMRGKSPHFGRFECLGEIEFHPGEAEGTLEGVGVAVLEAANGDLIVGVVTCRLDVHGLGHIHFSWRDSVEFSDGTVVSNTGRFQRRRPPGVVIAIIAILLG